MLKDTAKRASRLAPDLAEGHPLFGGQTFSRSIVLHCDLQEHFAGLKLVIHLRERAQLLGPDPVALGEQFLFSGSLHAPY
jgi:hypothetical protein